MPKPGTNHRIASVAFWVASACAYLHMGIAHQPWSAVVGGVFAMAGAMNAIAARRAEQRARNPSS